MENSSNEEIEKVLKEIFNNAENNYVKNKTRDIYESLETIDSLKFVYELLKLIVNGFTYEVETMQDKEDYKNLNNCLETIENILKKEGK